VSVTGLFYDPNGNILNLTRREGNSAAIDVLTYSYSVVSSGTNKLIRVSDTGNAQGFTDGNTSGNDYAYWLDGSLKQDLNKGITSITYNYLKLPQRITFSNGRTVDYQYDALGVKLKKTVTVPNTSTSVTEYVGNQVWEGGRLYQVAHAEGRISNTSSTTLPAYRYEWGMTDHLGNLRVSVADAGAASSLSVVQAQHYDPWGWELPTLGTLGNPVNRYKYNGKEDQPETGWYDYGARFYDKTIGRWGVIDPLAEKTHNITPYNYTINNPMLYSDPFGLDTLKSTARGFDWNNVKSGDVVDGVTVLQEAVVRQPRPDDDGTLTYSEARDWSHRGNGRPLLIDAATIDFSRVFLDEIPSRLSGQTLRVNLLDANRFANLSDAVTYGNLLLVRESDGSVTVLGPENYDFEIGGEAHPWTGSNAQPFRNILTIFGAVFNRLVVTLIISQLVKMKFHKAAQINTQDV
jgi:RHS repeat-associated protein